MKRIVMHSLKGNGDLLNVEEDSFSTILSNWKMLLGLSELEDRLDLVIGNCQDIESELLHISLIDSIFSRNNHNQLRDLNRKVNRLFLNLLSTCRTYMDQSDRIIKNSFTNKSEQFKTIKSSNYEANSNLKCEKS